MSQQDAFERILASLYEAMLDDDHWLTTSALIDEACGSKGNLLVSGDGRVEDDDTNIFFARFCYRGVRHLEWEHEYFSVFHPVDERIPRLRCLPDSELVHVTDLYTEEELKTSPTYNDALLRSQHQNSLNTRLDGPDGSRIVLAIADPVKDAGWSSAQINMIRRLLPHLRQFVSVRQALTESAALGASLAELLENARFGVIQVDRRAQIVAANDPALEFLREGTVLCDEEGALCATSRKEDSKLQRLLGRALPAFGDQGESGSMVVKNSSGPPAMVLHVVPVEDRAIEIRTSRAAALVLAIDPKRQPHIDRRMLRVTLGLTPAESEVAALLAEGLSVSEIVAAKGRVVDTVRWHVKQSSIKAGVSRQIDLVRVVQAISGFLPPPHRSER